MRRYPFMNNNGCQIYFILLSNLLLWIEIINFQKLVTHTSRTAFPAYSIYTSTTRPRRFFFRAPGQPGAHPVRLTMGIWLRALISDHGGPMGPLPQFFAYFTTIASNFLTGVICNCHPHGYISVNAKRNANGPVVFLLISINYHFEGAGKNVLPLKSHRNKNFQFLFQQC